MKVWTKHELETVRLTLTMSHRMGKVKVESKPMKINPAKMSTRDFNTLLKILQRYSEPKQNHKPKMKIIK